MTYLSSFFLAQLENIEQFESHSISNLCLQYLSKILESGSQSDFIFANGQRKYLVDLYGQSITSVGKYQRANNFKHLGDISLLISGYFTESIDDSVGIEYYISIGQAAYFTVADILEQKLFLELSRKYLACISIIHELSNSDKKLDPINIYRFWLATQSPYSKSKLIKLGIMTDIIEE